MLWLVKKTKELRGRPIRTRLKVRKGALRKHREQTELSLAEVARRLGYKSEATPRHWESGRCTPSDADLAKLAIFYDCEESALRTWKGRK